MLVSESSTFQLTRLFAHLFTLCNTNISCLPPGELRSTVGASSVFKQLGLRRNFCRLPQKFFKLNPNVISLIGDNGGYNVNYIICSVFKYNVPFL